jgi:hypothetical protein
MRSASHGGAYAPRSCFAMRMSADEKTIFAIHIRTSGQERRPSARRGNETHLQDGSLCVRRTTPLRAAGVSPPWFGNRACEDNSAHIPTRPSHAAPRAAGVSPPWFENRTCEDNSAHIPTRPSHAAPRAASVSPPSASPVGLWGMANGNVGEQDDRHPPTLPC